MEWWQYALSILAGMAVTHGANLSDELPDLTRYLMVGVPTTALIIAVTLAW